jgi:hypothetical protein
MPGPWAGSAADKTPARESSGSAASASHAATRLRSRGFSFPAQLVPTSTYGSEIDGSARSSDVSFNLLGSAGIVLVVTYPGGRRRVDSGPSYQISAKQVYRP